MDLGQWAFFFFFFFCWNLPGVPVLVPEMVSWVHADGCVPARLVRPERWARAQVAPPTCPLADLPIIGGAVSRSSTFDRLASMKTSTLSPIYLDDNLIHLMGDPRPLVAKIVAFSGKPPAEFGVRCLASKSDGRGKPLHPEEVIDRTAHPTQPIYLVSREKKSQMATDSGALPLQAPHEGLGRIPPMADSAAPATRPWTPTDPEWRF
jgi:hypothetical protein